MIIFTRIHLPLFPPPPFLNSTLGRASSVSSIETAPSIKRSIMTTPVYNADQSWWQYCQARWIQQGDVTADEIQELCITSNTRERFSILLSIYSY